MVQVSLADIERFKALVTDEVKMSGPVNWRSPEDILTDALERFRFNQRSSRRINCGTYLARCCELTKKKIKHIYRECELRTLVCWCVDPDFLSGMGYENTYVGMVKELLALRFHKASVSQILAHRAETATETAEWAEVEDVYFCEDEDQEPLGMVGPDNVNKEDNYENR